jgi:hypothetical protein
MATVTFRVIPQYENTVLIAPLAKSVFPTPLYANLFTNTQLEKSGLGAWFAAKIPPAGDRLTSGRAVLRLRSVGLPDPTS